MRNLLPAALVAISFAGCVDVDDAYRVCLAGGGCADPDLRITAFTPLNGASTSLASVRKGVVTWTTALASAQPDEIQTWYAPCTGNLLECLSTTGTELSAPAPSQPVYLDFPVPDGTRQIAWRMRACRTGDPNICGAWTRPRRLRLADPVGPVPGDLDHDGRADLLVGDPGPALSGGSVVIEGVEGSTTEKHREIDGPLYAGYGSGVAIAGDLNGDGSQDAVFGAVGTLGGNLWMFGAAGTSGYPTAPVAVDPASNPEPVQVYRAGDLDRDGHADFVALHPSSSQALIYHGSASGPVNSQTLGAVVGTAPFQSFAAVGHFFPDADGLDDLAASIGASGSVYLWHGKTMSGNLLGLSSGAGQAIAAGGDVDGDGYDDLLVLGPSNRVTVVFGGTASAGDRTATLSPEAAGESYLGMAGCDVDGDGASEVAVVLQSVPEIEIYRWDSEAGKLQYEGRESLNGGVQSFGTRIVCAGDLNDDGFEDLAVSGWMGGKGAVLAYLMRQPGASTELTFVSPSGLSSFGTWLGGVR